MDYLIVALLTIAVSFAILQIVQKKEKNNISKIIYRQSDMHVLMKHFFSKMVSSKIQKTQMTKREKGNAISILAIDEKAYWVINNVFYVADIINGKPDMTNAKPIDTTNMSKDDIDKMLFILDNLDRGDKDERGSTGN